MPEKPHDFHHGSSNKKHRSPGDGLSRPFVQAFVHKGQDGALEYLASRKVVVNVFLITGVMFEGHITSHDQYTITMLDARNATQMIYKDKISTIQIRRPGQGHGGGAPFQHRGLRSGPRSGPRSSAPAGQPHSHQHG